MASIKISDLTWDDLDEILYGSDDKPETGEIPEEAFGEILEEFEEVAR